MENQIAIRREDLSKKGEKRVALTPEAVAEITASGIRVLVQPGIHPETGESKRAYPDEAYKNAGATITESIEEADLIFGLKEVGIEHILPGKAWLFFSHTHKGQIKNRKMLQTLVDQKSTVFDYELITNAGGARVITAFTYFAGYAGMIDTLWTLGQHWQAAGIENVFTKVPQSIEKEDLELIKGILRGLEEGIRTKGTPESKPPVIVCFLGKGKTSHGAQEVFDCLIHEEIGLEQLKDTFEKGNRNTTYKLVLDIEEMFRLTAEAAEKHPAWATMDTAAKHQLYFQHPEYFESNLDQVLPYCTILMNCILWSPEFPRTIPNDLIAEIWSETPVLEAIGDITCDPNGSIEFSRETWIDNPVFTYSPAGREFQDGFTGNGIAVMAVTNLPCEFSADASRQFSTDFQPLLKETVEADFKGSLEESALPIPLKKACILWQGNFTPEYDYMKAFLE